MAKLSCLICEVQIMRLWYGNSNTRVCQRLMSIPFPVYSQRTWLFFTAFWNFARENDFFAYTPNSSSAINHASWRSQRVVVRSLAYTEQPLSTTNIPTGLSNFPFRGAPSPLTPRHSSLVFHPTEMLYALGGPDGTGKSTFFLALGGFLDYSTIYLFFEKKKNSTNHGLPSSLNLQLQVIPIIIIT